MSETGEALSGGSILSILRLQDSPMRDDDGESAEQSDVSASTALYSMAGIVTGRLDVASGRLDRARVLGVVKAAETVVDMSSLGSSGRSAGQRVGSSGAELASVTCPVALTSNCCVAGSAEGDFGPC